MDLFNVQLNTEVVAAMVEASKKLKANPAHPAPKADLDRRLSMFGSLGRSRRPSESDEDEDYEMNESSQEIVPKEAPAAIALRPVHKIVGFAF